MEAGIGRFANRNEALTGRAVCGQIYTEPCDCMERVIHKRMAFFMRKIKTGGQINAESASGFSAQG